MIDFSKWEDQQKIKAIIDDKTMTDKAKADRIHGAIRDIMSMGQDRGYIHVPFTPGEIGEWLKSHE